MDTGAGRKRKVVDVGKDLKQMEEEQNEKDRDGQAGGADDGTYL